MNRLFAFFDLLFLSSFDNVLSIFFLRCLLVVDDLEVLGRVVVGTINALNLPIVDPLIEGELWNDANTIKLSVGV